jgi:long-chain acyl-CoA synthetase
MGHDLSYGEFNQHANDFASFLQNELGLQKGDRLAIMLPNLSQMPIVLLGALKIGVICVNTNPLYTPREMKHQFADSGVKAIVILDLLVDKLESILPETQIEQVIVTSIGDFLPKWKSFALTMLLKLKKMIPNHNLKAHKLTDCLQKGAGQTYKKPSIQGDDLAILQYTGGTTGIAKGAMLTQKNVLANVFQVQEWAKEIVIKGEENILTALPLYHIFALSVNFLSFLTLGSRMILVPKPIPIKNLVKVFKNYRITIMTGVNTLFNALINDEKFRELAPKDLKVVIAGAAALQKSVAKEFYRITKTNITEGYGLTEASPVTHCNPLGTSSVVGSIGLPFPGTEAKVVDENGQDMPTGEVGELIIRGPQVMKGYWNRPEETANTLRNGWLWTGDMAKMDEKGFFFIVDRKKDMISVSGFNVYPNEIEAVIASHPKVLEAGVIGVEDEKSGETAKAFIVKKDQDLNAEEIKAYCRQNLTAYKIPRYFEFVEQLPKSNIGKILRRELKNPPIAS